ncbi:DCD (development and cell death) domain protein [Senna tora]|uniref:DCD (Development and cell death) domain protein n=1 Tax=Senna tora TaxID=362788 RepID=A0A834WZ58_9FABA|nr:DCD (development and cell death) domain protein [Senna tora]
MSGSHPEYGAIFMSNRSTMKECFEKRIFGLPYLFSDFVRGVKEGMLLFLFEYEERKLYGVFEASSDGNLNIVPEAYTSSGKQFPAQVKFTTIWQCEPLSEDEFGDAIRDNYFASYKFKFGLSKEQIQSLLWLFNSRKVKVPNSQLFNERKDIDNDLSPEVGCHRSLSSGDLKGASRKSENIHFEDDAYNPEHPDCFYSRALAVHHSFVANQEPGQVSINFMGKSENINCEDDAHNPEHPGGHYATALVVHHSPVTNLEPGQVSNNFVGQELVTLPEEKENFHDSVESLEDFIPLSSPDYFDPEGVAFNELYGEKPIELGEIVDYTESVFAVPKLPLEPSLNRRVVSQMKIEHPFALAHGSSYHITDESSVTSVPLLDACDGYQSKDRGKGMYSDCKKRRASVFSRLSFDLKNKEQGNQKGKPKKLKTEGCNAKKRASVFLRLASGSEALAQNVHCMTRIQQKSGGWKKIKREKAIVSECNAQEDGFKDDISIPEIMEILCQRHANW